MKTCTKCGVEQVLEEFSRRSEGGYKSHCKACVREYGRASYDAEAKHAYYEANRGRVLERRRAHYQANRAKQQQYMRSYQQVYYSSEANRERRSAYGRAHYEANRERRTAVALAWRLANPDRYAEYTRTRRARKLAAGSVPFTAGELAARMSVFGFRCWMCAGPFEHVDHVKPLAKGGPHMLSNLRPACAPCNRKKRDRWTGVRGISTLRRAPCR